MKTRFGCREKRSCHVVIGTTIRSVSPSNAGELMTRHGRCFRISEPIVGFRFTCQTRHELGVRQASINSTSERVPSSHARNSSLSISAGHLRKTSLFARKWSWRPSLASREEWAVAARGRVGAHRASGEANLRPARPSAYRPCRVVLPWLSRGPYISSAKTAADALARRNCHATLTRLGHAIHAPG